MSEPSILFLLARARQCADATFAKHAGADLSPRQYAVLKAIVEQPKSHQLDLSRTTGIDRSTISDIVRRLQRSRLITRKRLASDRRAFSIALTREGEKALRTGDSAAAATDAELLGKIAGRSATAISVITELAA